ncbi:sensor histidine kinase [Labilithrix luteola]|nr:ATP-binding protein [Labilithrix luteola]
MPRGNADKKLSRSAATLRERVLFELAKRDQEDCAATFRAITEAAAVAMNVERVSIWQLGEDQRTIVCKDLYLRSENRHEHGIQLLAEQNPRYFEALLERRVMDVDDVRVDPRTAGFADYFAPFAITAMMDVPIWRGGHLYGVLCHEHTMTPRSWQPDEAGFATNLADIVSVALERSARSAVEHRWDAVLDAMTEGVFLFDAKGDVVQANATARNLVERAGGGERFEERRGLIDYVDVNDRPLSVEQVPLHRALRGETVRGEVYGIAFRSTGARSYYRVTCTPLRSEERITGVVQVFADITEEVHFERLKRESLAVLAHELKTPLAITKGYAQHLASKVSTPEWLSMLQTIGRAADRMDRLVSDLLEVSSVMFGRVVLSREPRDLVAITRALVERTARGTVRHKIELYAPDPAWVMVDPVRIEQAIRRLVDNAVRYSPEGGDIDIAITNTADDVVLSVRDHGIGIPVDRQKHLFEVFARPHGGTPYDTGGLGVGLFLAREIVLRHEGAMWFENAEGRGTSFFVRLPRHDAPRVDGGRSLA